MILIRNKKNTVYPCKPQFYYIKVGFKGGSKLYRHVFVMLCSVSVALPVDLFLYCFTVNLQCTHSTLIPLFVKGKTENRNDICILFYCSLRPDN